MATILYSSTYGTDDPTRATLPFLGALGAIEAGHQAQILLQGEAKPQVLVAVFATLREHLDTGLVIFLYDAVTDLFEDFEAKYFRQIGRHIHLIEFLAGFQ